MIEFIVVYLIGGIATTFIMSLLDEKEREEEDYIRAGIIWPVTWLLAMFLIPVYLGRKLSKNGDEQDVQKTEEDREIKG